MMPSRGKGNPRKGISKDQSPILSGESSDVGMEESRSQSAEQREQGIGQPIEGETDLSLDHLFEQTTISEIATAIELDVESHAPSPAR